MKRYDDLVVIGQDDDDLLVIEREDNPGTVAFDGANTPPIRYIVDWGPDGHGAAGWRVTWVGDFNPYVLGRVDGRLNYDGAAAAARAAVDYGPLRSGVGAARRLTPRRWRMWGRG